MCVDSFASFHTCITLLLLQQTTPVVYSCCWGNALWIPFPRTPKKEFLESSSKFHRCITVNYLPYSEIQPNPFFEVCSRAEITITSLWVVAVLHYITLDYIYYTYYMVCVYYVIYILHIYIICFYSIYMYCSFLYYLLYCLLLTINPFLCQFTVMNNNSLYSTLSVQKIV